MSIKIAPYTHLIKRETMEYCPYCAEPLTKSYKICPYCKKALDTELLKQIYQPGTSSKVDKKKLLKILFMEKSHIIYPVITLIIGFIIGSILFYGFAQAEFIGERSDYRNQIADLNKTISDNTNSAGSVQQSLENTIAAKDTIITILTEQNDILNRVIFFTRRLTSNSTITPNSAEDQDYYRRNILYLIRSFEEQQEKLDNTEYSVTQTYDLRTIPEFLE
jgi:hypothetical protein